MRLTDLKPRWMTEVGASGHREGQVSRQQDAQGIRMLCPLCFRQNGGSIGTHSVIVPFKDRNVPADAYPRMARWEASGNDFTDLTTIPSILIGEGCGWHGFITGGEVSII